MGLVPVGRHGTVDGRPQVKPNGGFLAALDEFGAELRAAAVAGAMLRSGMAVPVGSKRKIQFILTAGA